MRHPSDRDTNAQLPADHPNATPDVPVTDGGVAPSSDDVTPVANEAEAVAGPPDEVIVDGATGTDNSDELGSSDAAIDAASASADADGTGLGGDAPPEPLLMDMEKTVDASAATDTEDAEPHADEPLFYIVQDTSGDLHRFTTEAEAEQYVDDRGGEAALSGLMTQSQWDAAQPGEPQ